MHVLMLFVIASQMLLAQASAAPLCVVTFRVVNVGGIPQSYRVASFRTEDGTDFADQFDGLRGRVPCQVSPYSFRLIWNLAKTEQVVNMTKLEGEMSASSPENWRTVATRPSVIVALDGSSAGSINASAPPGYVWRGRITPPPHEPLWVQIRSVVRTNAVGAAEIESAVDENGEFRAYGPFFANAPYVLYIVNEQGEIVYLTALLSSSVVPRQQLDISLPSIPLEFLRIR